MIWTWRGGNNIETNGTLESPSPDGFKTSFYQTYWHIVNEEVTSVSLIFLNDGVIDKCINFIYIVIIPKIQCLVYASNYRSISLCNVSYKFISKLLANRLKQVLLEIISTNQSTFMSRRLITNNIIVAYETLHYMKTR